VPSHPRPEDLSIGPPNIINGKMLAAESPAQYGYTSYATGGRPPVHHVTQSLLRALVPNKRNLE